MSEDIKEIHKDIARRKKSKLYMDRINYLKCVKGKVFSMEELYFFSQPQKAVTREKIATIRNQEKGYSSEESTTLNRLMKLDMEIVAYQLMKKGYSEKDATTVAVNILKDQFDNYLHRSININDYVIHNDLSIESKSEDEIVKNLNDCINFEMSKNNIKSK